MRPRLETVGVFCMTQFVFKGAYKEYRGYVFANGSPVTIKDESTDKLLRTLPDFEIYEARQTIEAIEPSVELPKEVKKRGRPSKR